MFASRNPDRHVGGSKLYDSIATVFNVKWPDIRRELWQIIKIIAFPLQFSKSRQRMFPINRGENYFGDSFNKLNSSFDLCNLQREQKKKHMHAHVYMWYIFPHPLFMALSFLFGHCSRWAFFFIITPNLIRPTCTNDETITKEESSRRRKKK